RRAAPPGRRGLGVDRALAGEGPPPRLDVGAGAQAHALGEGAPQEYAHRRGQHGDDPEQQERQPRREAVLPGHRRRRVEVGHGPRPAARPRAGPAAARRASGVTVYQPLAQGEQRRLGAALEAELGEEAGHVRLHRGLGHVEALGDGLVREALGHQGQHLGLALGERLAQLRPAHLPHEPRLGARVEAHLAAGGRPHGLERLVGPLLLQHVAGRAGLDHVDDEAVLEHRRERHDLDVGEAAPDLARGLDAVHDGHQQVHHDDVGPELLDELERLAPVARLADDLEVGLEPEGEPQAPPHDGVVVNEQDADLVHSLSPTRLQPRARPGRPTFGGAAGPPSGSAWARLPPLRRGAGPDLRSAQKEDAKVNSTSDRNSTAGLVLIAVGVVALLGSLGVVRFMADLLGALLFGGLAYLAWAEGRRRGSDFWRLAALPLLGLAVASIAPFGLGDGAFLASLGLAFAVYWHEDRRRWWA